MRTLEYQRFYRWHLPHIQPPGATLFVTFRLAGSIPADVLQRLRRDAEQREAALACIGDHQERERRGYVEERRHFARWDAELDRGRSGPVWLSEPRVGDLVAEALHYRDGRTYDLQAFCIMPNHVHTVFTPLPQGNGTYHALSMVMHSLKRYTARQANRVLGRQGTFWQGESYDHVVQDEEELHRIITYVLNNPVKGGLVQIRDDWRWKYCKYE